jgi:cellulose synthase/poly-beta-1,6-N-acetylglucosamine synthase-like glycosyltransferase
MIYFYISTIVFVGGIFIVYWLHNQYHLDIVVEPMPPPSSAPLISVCVPARNEERNIRLCVEAILAQDFPNFEVIVLEDRSHDSTPQILRELAVQDKRLKIIPGAELPRGWAGNLMRSFKHPLQRRANGCALWTPIRFFPQIHSLPVTQTPWRPRQICSPS